MSRSRRPCSIPDCTNSAHAGGMCGSHYWRWKTHGDALAGATPKGSGIRFIENVALKEEGDECLKWPLSINQRGYGQFGHGGKTMIAHRYICAVVNGPAPSRTHHAAHRCGNSWCVNPRHLQWATPVENNADKIGHGTGNKGERHGLSKLSVEDVLTIRRLAGSLSQRELGARFGISQTGASMIIRRVRWPHV